jgi:hypothetical protein
VLEDDSEGWNPYFISKVDKGGIKKFKNSWHYHLNINLSMLPLQ